MSVQWCSHQIDVEAASLGKLRHPSSAPAVSSSLAPKCPTPDQSLALCPAVEIILTLLQVPTPVMADKYSQSLQGTFRHDT